MLSSTWSFIFDLGTVLVFSSSRSARVDFPWSMCAMMQKFRTVSRRFIVARSEADMEGDGQARFALGVEPRPRGRMAWGLLGSEVGVEGRQVRVHVGVGHLEEVDREGPPDVIHFQVVVVVLAQGIPDVRRVL